MALPTTGQLSGDQIDDEFPDSIDEGRPMRLSEYRGVRASKNGVSYTLPGPGPGIAISYSDFRGVSAGYNIDVLIVGGGGGGGASRGTGFNAGGGGGGGYARLVEDLFVIPGTQYSIFVGRGGANGAFLGQTSEGSISSQGRDGTASSFTYDEPNNVIYTAGGGGGGGGCRTDNEQIGRNGACGGGAGSARGLVGIPNPIPGGNGNPGGDGGDADYSSTNREGGGGGGTNGNGGFAIVGGTNGIGGEGFNLNNWMGTANYRTTRSYTDSLIGSGVVNDGLGVGGGGGGGRTTSDNYVQGRDGGGWGCFPTNNRSGAGDQLRDGVNRTGGGGGGGCEFNGAGTGGSGVVIVRYRGTAAKGSGGNVRLGKVGNNETDFVFHVFGVNQFDQNLNATFTA